MSGLSLGHALSVLLPLVVMLGVLAGALSAALCRLAWLEADPERASAGQRIRSFFVEGDAPIHARRIAGVLAALVVLGAGGFGAYRAVYTLVIDMAQPRFVALSSVAVFLVLAVACAGLWVPVRNGLQWIVKRVQSVPRVGWLVSRTDRMCALLSLMGTAAIVWVARSQRFALSYLPWESIGVATGALIVGGLIWWGLSRAPRWASRAALALVALMTLVSSVVASTSGDAAIVARIVTEERTLSGASGYRALRVLLDHDDDGHLDVLGGGDCAPHNPAIHPGATDLPENRIDEDCDGEDLTARMVENPGGYRFSVPAEWPKRPPIVLITVDAFAATRMAAFGNDQNVTPRIDAFANQAALFRACFAQGPSTRLSVPSMFTSRWDSQIAQRLEGKHPYPIDDSELTLAEVLQKEGYDTAAVLPDGYFDPGHWRGITAGFRTVDTSSYRRDRSPHNAQTVTNLALAELAKPRKRPLFLWVHYYDAHSPHTQPAGAPLRGPTLGDIYDAELALVDREVGRLLDGLDRDPTARPLIVLTADHGIDFDPTHHAKFNYGYDLYTSVLHVPLIVRVPGASTGRFEHLVSTMDIAPTIANVLRLKGRFPFQGVSLVREIAEGFSTQSRRLIHQFYIFENYWKNLDPLEKISLRTERFNLIHDRKRGAYELYDWKADYYEAKDLVRDPAFASVLKDLRKQLSFFTYSLHRRPPPIPGEPARRR